MSKVIGNKKFKHENRPTPKSGQYVATTQHKSKVVAMRQDSGRATVDDATWEKIVMGLMEEYDEAWTQLADR
jgi:hypothetical protein